MLAATLCGIYITMATSINSRKRSLPKGLLAGLLGGIAGAAVILVAEEIFPPRQAEEPAPPAANPPGPQALHLTLHWALGAVAGGLYGMATELEPSLAAWRGAAFGITLNRITQDSRLPRMGLAQSKYVQSKNAPSTSVSQWISHAAYGIATDSIRRVVRRFL